MIQSHLQQEKNEGKNLKELGAKRPETQGADIDIEKAKKSPFPVSSP